MLNKRGQLAIIVIVAIVIVGVVLVFLLFPRTNLLVNDVNPSSFLRQCIEPEISAALALITTQGGSIEPDNYVLYDGNKIQYLCYTANDYEPCVVQQPLLLNQFETELAEYIQPRARECVNELQDQYERQGYSVQTTPGEISVDIIAGSISVDFLSPMTISRETTQTFQKFAVSVDSQLYDLILIATSIIEFESTLGDSETTLYIQYYPDLRIDKTRRDDDTIYQLSNVVTEDAFTFATRSLVWPTGYGELEL